MDEREKYIQYYNTYVHNPGQVKKISTPAVRYMPSLVHILTAHLTNFHCGHIHLPCAIADQCPICRPHSDPVGCSWFQTSQCDTSGGPSHNPLILWSHHWGSSKVLSLIAHIVSCSTKHLRPGDTHCRGIGRSLCSRGGWLQGSVHCM